MVGLGERGGTGGRGGVVDAEGVLGRLVDERVAR